jgi:uncharacterized YccA/Bax inhibitor family protein
MATAYWAWIDPTLYKFTLPFVIVGFICALVITFKRTMAPMLTPVYAAVEGAVLGSISVIAEQRFPGIAFQAISLTFGTLFCLMFAFKSGWIKMSDKLRMGIVAATGAIFIVYLISFVLSLFGVPMAFMNNSSPLSIGISCVVVVIAAANLVLDFDFIQTATRSGNQPKYMEWVAAFGLLVTLVWLYMEILRLLMKLNSRRD